LVPAFLRECTDVCIFFQLDLQNFTVPPYFDTARCAAAAEVLSHELLDIAVRNNATLSRQFELSAAGCTESHPLPILCGAFSTAWDASKTNKGMDALAALFLRLMGLDMSATRLCPSWIPAPAAFGVTVVGVQVQQRGLDAGDSDGVRRLLQQSASSAAAGSCLSGASLGKCETNPEDIACG
jgi:hypothetical protein